MASSSSLVPNPSCKKYDVFLSFRGVDTRNGFTGHLHKALLKKNIETYIDERLERGDVISDALLKAIEESQLSIIIFSENYASSTWCLEELVHILQCKKKNGQIVIPIFYHVDPSDVRKQQGTYDAVALTTLAKRFQDNTEKLNQWRASLTTAANLSGWGAPTTTNESELVESIVNYVERKLISVPINDDDDCKGLVGIHKRIEYTKSILLIHSSVDQVRIVGIWGMGGLGKTTIARIVFRRLYSQFEGSCFLENVREEWQKHGSVYLENNFFSQLVGEKNLCMAHKEDLRKKLSHKRVLIVLDDVDDVEHFEFLVRGREWFQHGSRIVITTRNKQVLRNIGVDVIYNLEQLNEEEALQLFSLNAFKRSTSPESYMELSRKVVNYAKGVPLALKVLGSHLYSRNKEEWESSFKVNDLDRKIQNVLEISFNGLQEKEKAIFLDIACFLRGMRRDHIEDILDDCTYVITVLIDKSLITITAKNTLWMHDLVHEMGWKIARGQGIRDSLKSSRLWITNYTWHLLETITGSETIEGIFLDASAVRLDVNSKPEVFERMHLLRLLKVSARCSRWCHFHLPQGLRFLPDKLVYLEWDNYPFHSLPFTPYKYLVKIQMRSSQLKQLWNGVQDLEKLKYVNLEYSVKLVCIPDLSRASLKILDLKGCTSLVDVPPMRFQQVAPREKSLVCSSDVFSRCHDEGSKWKPNSNVVNYMLDLRGCSNLKTLSNLSGNIEYINLDSTAVEELHYSICYLHSLVSIDLNKCEYLKTLPRNICALESLEYLNLEGCLSFNNLPAKLPKSLIELNLSGTAIEKVHPSSFECLPSLKVLNMNNCTRLESLPTSICKLKSLEILSLSHCLKLKFPDLEPMEWLKVLNLKGNRIKELPTSIGNKSELLSAFFVGRSRKVYPIRTYNQLLTYEKGKSLTNVLVDEIEVDLTYSSIFRIPDWYYREPLLPLVVDQSTGTTSDTITMAIKSFEYGVPEFQICKCKNLGHHCGSFSFINYVDERQDRNEIFILIRRHTYVFCISTMKISCCECSNFDLVREKVTTESQINILQRAMASTVKRKELEYSRSIFVCQGNAIPQWFSNQSMGSSIEIKLSPHWHNTSFLGFAFCIFIKINHPGNYGDCRTEISCKYRFKTPYDRSQQTFHWSLRDIGTILDESDQILIHYLSDDDYHKYHDATEASFEFYLQLANRFGIRVVDDCKVAKCGIRMLYRQDTEELIRRNY